MDRLIDNALLLLVAILLGFIVYGFAIVLPEDRKIRGSLYTECLTTDYDKFQCYSMIYGDK